MATGLSAQKLGGTIPAAAAANSRAIQAPVNAEPTTACSAASMTIEKANSIWPTKTVISL